MAIAVSLEENGTHMDMLKSSTIPILEQLTNFTQARHNVLAGNIANVDTPGYIARDLSVTDFQTRLQTAIDASRRPPVAGSLIAGSATPLSTASDNDISHVTENILYHDQSNVGEEYQVNEMVKNRMQFNLAVSILSQQFRLLGAAISEKA